MNADPKPAAPTKAECDAAHARLDALFAKLNRDEALGEAETAEFDRMLKLVGECIAAEMHPEAGGHAVTTIRSPMFRGEPPAPPADVRRIMCDAVPPGDRLGGAPAGEMLRRLEAARTAGEPIPDDIPDDVRALYGSRLLASKHRGAATGRGGEGACGG